MQLKQMKNISKLNFYTYCTKWFWFLKVSVADTNMAIQFTQLNVSSTSSTIRKDEQLF